jgi:hypothetical protein
MTRAEILFPSLLFVVVAAFLIAGLTVLDYSWAVIAFPLGAGVIMCALCVVEVARTLAGHSAPPLPEQEELEPLTWGSVAWVFALGGFVYGLGFVFGPAAYLLVYLRANGSSWRLSIGIAAASLLVTWGLFIKLLRVLLPIEPLWM